MKSQLLTQSSLPLSVCVSKVMKLEIIPELVLLHPEHRLNQLQYRLGQQMHFIFYHPLWRRNAIRQKDNLVARCLQISYLCLLQFITDGERPEGSPKNIRISALTSTELEVMWDEPDPEQCHGTIIRYNIGYKEFG